ncbi:MAG: hypothetical protein ACTSV5_13225 [Promethearchaeota archaeon]
MFRGSQSEFTFQNYMDKRLTAEHQYPFGQELVHYFNEYKAELELEKVASMKKFNWWKAISVVGAISLVLGTIGFISSFLPSQILRISVEMGITPEKLLIAPSLSVNEISSNLINPLIFSGLIGISSGIIGGVAGMVKIAIDKIEIMREIVINQIHEYLRTGHRLLSITEASLKAGISIGSTSKYTKLILAEMYNEPKATGLYELMFGRITTTYRGIKDDCKKNNFKLITTLEEWIDLVSDRGEARPSRLHVLVACDSKGHITSMMVESLKTDHGCEICRHDSYRLTLDYAKECADSRGYDILSTEAEFDAAYKIAISKGLIGSYAKLLYRHRDCGHIFKSTHYDLIARGATAVKCPKCGQFKNQKITHAMSEYLFEQDFIVGERLVNIFPELKTSVQYNDIRKIMSVNLMHIDISNRLNIRDKYGNTIKLGIEFQGDQHENTEKGFRTYLRLSRFKGVEGDAEWIKLRKEWRTMLLRDQFKVDIYASKELEGYYLIVVPYEVKPRMRLSFLAEEFYKKTGVRILKNYDNFDWKTFLL